MIIEVLLEEEQSFLMIVTSTSQCIWTVLTLTEP
uniref:AP-4 complex subunit mu-1, putative n=1 Tax=Arundo donax TaxID=35708 RepID=A0A0A9G611_ARUDO